MRLIHRIRCSIDESYRIRMGFGLSPLRNKREVKALIAFCRIESVEYRKNGFYGSSHLPVWEETVRLYEYWERVGIGYEDFIEYVENHVGWYWS